jgi:hypothetical protein
MYAILNTKTKELATLSFSSNGDAEFCNDTTCAIGFGDNAIFIAKEYEIAKAVLTENTGWYNSDMQTPTWGRDFERELSNLKVVRLKVEEIV